MGLTIDETRALAACVAYHTLGNDTQGSLSRQLEAHGVGVAELMLALQTEVDDSSIILPTLQAPKNGAEASVTSQQVAIRVKLYGTNRITGADLRDSLEGASKSTLIDYVVQHVAGWTPPKQQRSGNTQKA